ncbi:hypothetical protein EOD39_20600 [Acipenser ruthenus]|uniref:Uncharacterized protein n=1 Tax=Acipenser ruthenus TaxID=7906 RepID=A0A444UUZ7_ACIRT|nr:hypothetical protein EOD39_20600 [Acipenser ruthenus]
MPPVSRTTGTPRDTNKTSETKSGAGWLSASACRTQQTRRPLPVRSHRDRRIPADTHLSCVYKATASRVTENTTAGVSLPSTPISRAVPPPRSRYTVTPLALPVVCPAVVPLSVNQCGARVNPLHPPAERRRTVSLETLAAHHYNQQRVQVMQQKEYCRYHQGWQRPFYGSRADKEEYRQEVRALLKRQIREKWEGQRQALASRMREVEAVREADRLVLNQDLEQNRIRARALTVFRDENKRLMEQSWKERSVSRSLEALRERELLQYNPINWSGTLK